jgi:hypothetical protein
LKLGPALTLSQNPFFEMASNKVIRFLFFIILRQL